MSFQIDCSATVNVLPSKYVSKSDIIKDDNSQKVTLKMWNGTMVDSIGTYRIKVKNPKTGKKYRAPFVLVKSDFTPLISRKTAEDMGIIAINYEVFKPVHIVQDNSCADIRSEFPKPFENGLGQFRDDLKTVKLHADDGVPAKVVPAKRVAIALKPKAKAALDYLERKNIIIKQDSPTDWVSQMAVSVKRSGELRICIDPQALNQALKREHYQLPVIEDILPDLNKVRIFSKLDLRNGFWHCELDEESSLLTTFSTPFGRYRWKKLPFGLSVSSEIFQKRLNMAIEGLNGVKCIADDLLVVGEGDTQAEAMSDHDNNLRALLSRATEHGMKFKWEKCEFRKTELSFMGHVITSGGLQADPIKIEAVLALKKPNSVDEVHQLGGFVNYLAKFLPNLSKVMEPISRLTRNNEPWVWSSEQDKAFGTIKQLATQSPVRAYYDPEAELVLQCDASQDGLGVALLQNGRPVTYASRALTETEKQYAQIEKEALSIVFRLFKFHLYTFARPVIVHNDHKPLEAIFKKPLHKAPKRLQGMFLKIHQYDVDIQWKPGKDVVVADLLSWSYMNDNTRTTGEAEFTQINMVSFLPISEARLIEIQRETEADETLQLIKPIILQGWPEDKVNVPDSLLPYFHIRDELSVQNGLIFRGERVIIPKSMRPTMINAVHKSHLGINSCLRRARECLFWPGMSSDIKIEVEKCSACREFETSQAKETLMSHEIPSRPWAKVGCDLLTLD